MKVAKTVADMREARRGLKGPVGLVPTMGYLHEGHLSLVRRAKGECSSVVATIFVNPTQFGPQEDLAAYPRDLERDLAMLEAEGTDVVFVPSAEEMYAEGFDSWVEVGGVTTRLEGDHRSGHFRGVTTVCLKLFNITQADKAYFGRKDAQQLRVIRKMVSDLNLPLEIVPCATVRESDGLAMSSRNKYLSPEERQASRVLYRALTLAQDRYDKGERDAVALRREMEALIRTEPRAGIDYVSIADDDTLEELETIDRPALVSLAVNIGKTRLIDNVTLGAAGSAI